MDDDQNIGARARLAARVGLVALCTISGTPLVAQTSGAATDSSPAQDAPEVTVIGKRLQNLRDVAGTVNVLGAKELTEIGAKDAEDIFKLAPGVQFNKGSADGAMLTIRGIGTNTSSDNTSTGQLPTGIYIEDIPFTDPFQYISTPDLAAFDLDSVKVMRGPQGALYGSGSLGGAVNYTFKKPELDRVGGSILGTLDSANGGNTRASGYAALNLPIVRDVLAIRVDGQYQSDPAYIDNIGTGKTNVNGRTVKGGRALILFKPTDNLTIDGLYIYQESHQGDTSASISPGVYYYSSPRPSSYRSKFGLAKLEINYVLGPIKLTSLTAHQTKERNLDGDLTRLLVPDATIGIDVSSVVGFGVGPFPNVKEARNVEFRRSNGLSQEFRIASAEKGVFNWLVGAFGQNVNFHRIQDVTLTGANDPVFGDLFFDVHRDGKAEERALFGEVNLDFGNLELGAGGRWFNTSVDYRTTNAQAMISAAKSKNYHYSESGFTPKFQARYHLSREAIFYASASKGYRFGGISSTPGNPTYKSDNLWNYEAGVRLEPARNFTFDLAGFYIDWKNPQVTTADQNGFLIVSNVGSATSKGVEISSQWRPVAGLRLNGTFTYIDAKTGADLQSTRNFATDVAGGFTGNFIVPAGTRLPGTARIQANFEPQFEMAGPLDSRLTWSALVNYTGSRRAQIDNDLMLPAYTTVDLRVKAARDGWEIGLAASNIFNSKGISSAAYSYFTTGTGAAGYADYYLIRPRIISLSIRKDF